MALLVSTRCGLLNFPNIYTQFNYIAVDIYLPKVYVEFFNRAPLKSRFCGPKALQKGKYMYLRSFRTTTIFKILEEEEEEFIKELNMACEH